MSEIFQLHVQGMANSLLNVKNSANYNYGLCFIHDIIDKDDPKEVTFSHTFTAHTYCLLTHILLY